MGQSLHQVYGHLVFSTKERATLISADHEGALYDLMGGIVRNLGGSAIEINGMPDHVHVLIRASKSTTDMEFMRQLKGSSSKWMNEACGGGFKWQGGYGWFSVGPQDLEKARAYVQGQKEHHRTESFQEEFRRFLKRYGVEYDERYVWD
ncbi:MAG: IS200/IS605 family transposase [Verrucomicrobia bacterium]|nr:IS200/IS605 family transposase [Verrucomicrobiota bacterium]